MGNTPNIRFIGFTDDWEQRKLSEVAEFNPKSELPETFEYVDLESVVGTEMVSHRTETRETAPSRAQRLARTGDVFFQTVRPYQRNNYLFEKPDNNYVFSTGYAQMRPKIDAEFLMCFLQTDSFVKVVLDNCTGTSYPAINSNDLSNLEIVLPASDDEQRRIGSFISNLDHLITLHQRKCDEMKKMKKFMLQKMFPKNGQKNPEIRFDGFTDDWEQRKLSEFGEATGGTSIESEFSADGIYKVISIGSYSEDNIYRDQGIRAVRSDKTINRILNKGDITMILNDKTASGNIIGRVLLIEESGVYVYNQRTERIEVGSENYNSQFIYKMLNAPEIRDKIIKQSQGNTQIYVNWTTVSQTDYLVPQIEEQIKIGEYFKSIDNLITLHQRKVENLKNLKKYMLQNMFV